MRQLPGTSEIVCARDLVADVPVAVGEASSDGGIGRLEARLGSPERPSWRGRIHLWALACIIPPLVAMAVQADGGRARAGVIIYTAGLCSMLAVSTTYHRWVHTTRARAAWRRADHATIFAAIAG